MVLKATSSVHMPLICEARTGAPDGACPLKTWLSPNRDAQAKNGEITTFCKRDRIQIADMSPSCPRRKSTQAIEIALLLSCLTVLANRAKCPRLVPIVSRNKRASWRRKSAGHEGTFRFVPILSPYVDGVPLRSKTIAAVTYVSLFDPNPASGTPLTKAVAGLQIARRLRKPRHVHPLLCRRADPIQVRNPDRRCACVGRRSRDRACNDGFRSAGGDCFVRHYGSTSTETSLPASSKAR